MELKNLIIHILSKFNKWYVYWPGKTRYRIRNLKIDKKQEILLRRKFREKLEKLKNST